MRKKKREQLKQEKEQRTLDRICVMYTLEDPQLLLDGWGK